MAYFYTITTTVQNNSPEHRLQTPSETLSRQIGYSQIQ